MSCGSEGAILEIIVHNPTGSTISSGVSLSGAAVSGGTTCTSFAGSYSKTSGFDLDPGDNRILVTGLNSGTWVHTIGVSIGANVYQQHQKGIVLKATPDDPNDPNDPNDPSRPFSRVDWTYYANSIEVTDAGDAGSGSCSTTCTLRQAITTANTISTSSANRALIFFSASPGTMTQSSWLGITKPIITIDGTNVDGNPWIVGDTLGSQAAFPTTVDLANETTLIVGSGVVGTIIKGLEIKNTTVSEMPQFALVYDLGEDTLIEATRLDGGAGDFEDCSENGGICDYSFLVYGTETSLANIEGRGAFGAAYAGSAVRIVDSWLHHNLGGHVAAHYASIERSTLELKGFNFANQQIANSEPAIGGGLHSGLGLETNANLIRNNVSGGIAMNAVGAGVDLQHDYICGNSDFGIKLALTDTSNPSGIGVAAAYNAGVGLLFTGSQGGAAVFDDDNAFTANSSAGLENASTGSISATNNQWRDVIGTCTGSADISGPNVDCDPAQDWLDDPIVLDATAPVFPTNVIQVGQVVRLRGTGFNAIHGNPEWDDLPGEGECTLGVGASGSNCCRMATKANSCAGSPPTAVAGEGNCVAIRRKLSGAGSSDNWTPAELAGVTPTTLTFGLPSNISCIGELDEQIRVSKRDGSGDPIYLEVAYCTNSIPK